MRLPLRRPDSSADSLPYLSLLKLHTAPFSSKTGSAFFYADAERTRYLDMLQQLTKRSEQPLLVVGEKGVGKSALIDKYLERVEEQWRLCRLDAEQGVGLDTLSARVAECFAPELGTVEAPQLPDALRQQLDTLAGMQLSVLLIDDAHALSDETLEMVLHLAALEGGKLIRVLLFADGSIEERLKSPRFAKIAVPHRIELSPLQELESAVYLLHRLQRAGYSGSSPFSAADMKQLYRQSRGIPAQLNLAAHALLLKRSKHSGAFLGLSATSLRYGIAMIALIATVLVMHERINAALGGGSGALAAEPPAERLIESDKPGTVTTQGSKGIRGGCGSEAAEAECPTLAELPLEGQAARQSPLIKPETTSPEPEGEEGEAENVVATAPEGAATAPLVIKPPLPTTVLAEGVETVDAIVAEQAAEKTKQPQRPELSGVSPDPVIGSDQPQTITLLGRGLEAGSKVAVSRGGMVERLEPSQVVVRDSGHMEITVTTGVEPAPWAVEVSSPGRQRSNVIRFQVEAPRPGKAAAKAKGAEGSKAAVEKATQKKLAAAASGGIQGSGWVAAQPAANFTLQLIAASERNSLHQFLSDHPALEGPVASFEQQRENRRVQVLIQGSYASRAQAEAAAKALPDKLQPWIRDFAGIKKVMRSPAEPATAAEPLASGELKDTAWVWSQNPNHFTIQLSGAVDEASIEADMQDLSLPGERAVVQTLRDGKPWYALIYGRFADKAAAQRTMAGLPQRLKKAGPWVRRFSALQDEIARAARR